LPGVLALSAVGCFALPKSGSWAAGLAGVATEFSISCATSGLFRYAALTASFEFAAILPALTALSANSSALALAASAAACASRSLIAFAAARMSFFVAVSGSPRAAAISAMSSISGFPFVLLGSSGSRPPVSSAFTTGFTGRLGRLVSATEQSDTGVPSGESVQPGETKR